MQKPDSALAAKVVAKAREKNLILLSCGTNGNVLRILVPLTVGDDQLQRGLEIIGECFDQLV